jgi:peroxiredoxin
MAKIEYLGATMAEKLNTGDTFPSLTLELVSGGTMTVPGDLDSKYKVILFYRGHW